MNSEISVQNKKYDSRESCFLFCYVHPESFTNADALRDLGFQPRSLGTEITIFFVLDEGMDLPGIFIRVSGRRASDEPMYELFQIVEATEAEIIGIAHAFMPNTSELVEQARIEACKAAKKLEGLERFEGTAHGVP
jgi:hypothetical protein